MSRSFRKNPIIGITKAKSEKRDKITSHRKFRRAQNNLISQFKTYAEYEFFQEDEKLPFHQRDLTSVWSFAKDGKQYCGQDLQEYILKLKNGDVEDLEELEEILKDIRDIIGK